MAQLVREGWPLYLVTHTEVRRLPFRLVDVVLISASLAFARSFCSHLEVNLGRPLGILRVTYYNRCMPVRSQSSAFVEQLDKRWCRPPSVIEAAYCVLCIKPDTSKCNVSTPMTLEGVNASHDLGTFCQAHQLKWSPQSKHERAQLNVLSSEWGTGDIAAAATLRSTKVAWVGPQYFARAMSGRFPAEVLDRIILNATICEEQ